MPVAKITDGINGNIGTLHKLHLKSLSLPNHKQERITRGTTLGRKKVYISSKMVIKGLKGLNKGKAGGQQVDSLDLFIKLARSRNKGKKKAAQFNNRHKTLAAFFSSIANTDVSNKVARILRTTYLVALQKDPEDLSKLRPLGVLAGIRRITAVLISQRYWS